MKNGTEAVRNPGALDETESIHTPQGVDYFGLRSKTSATREVLEASLQLKAIDVFCIGTSQVDLGATTELGICVFSTPYSNTRSAVELAIDEIIDLCRHVTVKNSRLHRGIWDKSADGTHEVRGRTLDIISYGDIGTQLSVLTEVMGLNIILYDVAERFILGGATQMPTMEFALYEADIVSVHVSSQLVNANLFKACEFAMIGPRAFFINPSRGFITNIDVLHDALVLGHLASVAVGVFPEEPNESGDPFTSPLVKLDNVVLTPHVGGPTEEAQYDIGCFIASKIIDYENMGSADISVNLPSLRLNALKRSCYRIALIHRNTPGVLAAVNNTFAQTGANIGAQTLGTAG